MSTNFLDNLITCNGGENFCLTLEVAEKIILQLRKKDFGITTWRQL